MGLLSCFFCVVSFVWSTLSPWARSPSLLSVAVSWNPQCLSWCMCASHYHFALWPRGCSPFITPVFFFTFQGYWDMPFSCKLICVLSSPSARVSNLLKLCINLFLQQCKPGWTPLLLYCQLMQYSLKFHYVMLVPVAGGNFFLSLSECVAASPLHNGRCVLCLLCRSVISCMILMQCCPLC